MASTRGRQVVVPLTNKSGGAVAAGDVVVVDTGNNEAFTTSTAGAVTGGVGIAQDAIANNAIGRVLLHGYAALVNVSASVTRGNYGKTHTVAKQAVDAGASRVAGVFCQFLTGGTTPTARVFSPDLGAAAGNVAADAIFDAKGDLPVGTGADTAAKLTVGANGTRPEAASGETTGIKWSYPPGYEFDYVEITSPVVPTATTEATANTVVTANAVSFDGSTAVIIEFMSQDVRPRNDAAGYIILWLYDGSSSIGQIAFVRMVGTGNQEVPVRVARRLTPSNASHTYSIRASVSGGTTAQVDAGAGGAGNSAPAFIRITKAA